jgi:hypothetical protein
MKREISGAVLEIPTSSGPPDGMDYRAGLSVVVGILSGFGEDGRPYVVVSGSTLEESLAARSIVDLSESELGCHVVLAFESGDRGAPIVMGVLQEPNGRINRPNRAPVAPAAESERQRETLTLTAKQEIVLRCGQASVTLTRAGKILLRGAYLLSRSSGVNRIKGGSVQIN